MTDTSAVTSNFVNSLWGLDTPPPTVTDSQLANLLAPYLGTLPPYAKNANGYIIGAPFTKNMTIANYDLVQKFLTNIQNTASSDATLQADLTDILAAAQAPQVPVFGQPAPLPPGSGGLARNTASTLGVVIASLQTAGILSALSGTTYAVNTTGLAAWLGNPSNITLINDALTQLNQDVPITTGIINVNGVDQEIRIPLNQSLQEVLQTQYVQHGANIVYAGLQALVDQQQGAEDSIRALNGLQQVYNGIQVDSGVTVFSDTSALTTALEAQLAGRVSGGIISFSNPPYSLNINWNDSGSVADIEYSLSSEGLVLKSTHFSDPLSQDIFNQYLNPIVIAASTTKQVLSSTDITNILSNMTNDPKQYLTNLPDAIAALFPKPGTTVGTILLNGVALSLSVDPAQGNFLWLLNNLYKNYLGQAAQRLIEADSNIMVNPTMVVDPATGKIQLILNPNVASSPTEQAKLQIVRSIQAYANKMNIDGTGTNNLIASDGTIPTATIPLIASGSLSAVGAISLASFGAAVSGSLEGAFATVLRNLLGPDAIFGLSGSNTNDARITANSSGIDITNWILGNWPGGSPVAGVALDQTQSYLSNGFSAASSLNDSLQQQLQQSFFLFQEFMQSATDTLSAINQLIVKKAQAIAG